MSLVRIVAAASRPKAHAFGASNPFTMAASVLSKNLRLLIDGVLKPLGFVRSSSTWHLDTPDAVGVINLQRSMWGASYYINVGIYVKALGTLTQPKEYDCHYRGSIENFLLIPGFKGELRFDDDTIDLGEAEAAVITGMIRAIAPIVRTLTLIDSLRFFALSNPLLIWRKELRELLKIPTE